MAIPEWPKAQLDMLDNLWAAGKTAAEIAEAISLYGPKRTRNAVLGKVHRRGLTARPSPIRRNPNSPPPKREQRPPPAPRSTLPDLEPAPKEPRPKAARTETAERRTPAERAMDTILGRAKAAAAPPALTSPIATAPIARYRTCQWPIDNVDAPGFRFCGDPTATGRSYCPAHCQRAYTTHAEQSTAA